MTDIDLESLLTELDAFVGTMYAVRHHLGFQPEKEHVVTCIDYLDLQELREEFVAELVATMIPFVYSETRRKALLAEFAPGRSPEGAHERLRQLCLKKFRQSSSQGQFSELLLCNLLQHYFRAVPLVRKMPLTTNPNTERQGADAIHLARVDGKFRIYLGEAKTYAGKSDNLRVAFNEAVNDLVYKHYANLRNELDLYIFEPFIPPQIEAVARDFRAGKLKDAEVHLVAIVSYDFRDMIRGSREERLKSIVSAVQTGLQTIPTSKLFSGMDTDVLPRLNFIIFPAVDLAKLVANFRHVLGIH
jgi:hypothetical protein